MAVWAVLVMIFAALAGAGNFSNLINGKSPAAGTNILLAAILFVLGLLLWFQDDVRSHVSDISDKLGPKKEHGPAGEEKRAVGRYEV